MATSPKQSQILQLQQEITREVTGDAASIAQGVFGDNKNHPDMAQVSNQHLDDLYRQKYQSGDRQWLQAEARRDPQQFLDVAKRIGVQVPAPGQPSTAVDPNAFAKAAMANAAPPPAVAAPLPAPMAAPAPVPALPVPPPAPAPAPPALTMPPGLAPPPAVPPVLVGPNGQPLGG